MPAMKREVAARSTPKARAMKKVMMTEIKATTRLENRQWEGAARGTPRKAGQRTHFFMDVLNLENSSYNREEQHTIIDLEF